jgi:YidC/Oxa1 family membrane protein insertase
MDRRVVKAVLLMMAVLIVPSLLFKRPPPPIRTVRPDSVAAASGTVGRPDSLTGGVPAVRRSAGPPVRRSDSVVVREDTVVVTSPLYRYEFSTVGGRMIGATLLRYPSMRPVERRQPAEILQSGSDLLGLGVLVGRDTVWLRDWDFTPSAASLDASASRTLTFTGLRGGLSVVLTYSFQPDNYLVDVTGKLQGLGPEGATLLVGMGPGLRNTESDSVEHHRELGVVVKGNKASLTRFTGLVQKVGDQYVPRLVTFNGPFEWVAVKNKYFVAALLAFDTLGTGLNGGISGASAAATDLVKAPAKATVMAGLPLASAGSFQYQLYAGPLEYPRLRALGHDFDDVNPYGWPGFRTIIRPVALGARSLLVWWHDGLGLAYGVGLILFGILIRILLWPLNQKAMRSTMAMQVVQPLLKELQDKYKSDPQRLQQEMFKLYKEHNVNPLGGCWPMLLPWPVLIALFFVFQNTIELRGASFLWLPDLSRPDPLHVIPIVMGLSMFLLSWIGMRGLPPNPQSKMMLYMMPALMTFLFLNFASGLNLYYTVMNLASLPQQAMIARERARRIPPAAPPVQAKGKKG